MYELKSERSGGKTLPATAGGWPRWIRGGRYPRPQGAGSLQSTRSDALAGARVRRGGPPSSGAWEPSPAAARDVPGLGAAGCRRRRRRCGNSARARASHRLWCSPRRSGGTACHTATAARWLPSQRRAVPGRVVSPTARTSCRQGR